MKKSSYLILFFLVLSWSLAAETLSIGDAVAAYNMDSYQNGNLVDISGHGHDSSGLGGSQISSGLNNNALSFDGSDQVIINDSADLRLGTQMTIEAKFTITSLTSDWVRVVGKGLQTPRNYGLWYNPVTYRLLFQIYSSSGYLNAYFDAGSLNLNHWYHLAGSYDGSVGRLYLDGVQVATHAVSITPYTSADPLTIGGANFHKKHIGQIDDVALYDRVLSADDIAFHASHDIGIIPEPGTIGLFLFGIFFLYRRKRLSR